MSALGENAARWMAWLTSKGGPFDVGYSQPRRFSPEIHAAIAAGGGVADMDCSSGVALAYNAGGMSPPFPEDGTTWTGSLRVGRGPGLHRHGLGRGRPPRREPLAR